STTPSRTTAASAVAGSVTPSTVRSNAILPPGSGWGRAQSTLAPAGVHPSGPAANVPALSVTRRTAVPDPAVSASGVTAAAPPSPPDSVTSMCSVPVPGPVASQLDAAPSSDRAGAGDGAGGAPGPGGGLDGIEPPLPVPPGEVPPPLPTGGDGSSARKPSSPRPVPPKPSTPRSRSPSPKRKPSSPKSSSR